MDQKVKKVELSAFVSAETPRVRPVRGGRLRQDKSRRGHRRAQAPQAFDATSMLIKCGVCAAACALVLLMKWVGTPATEDALETVKQAVTEEEELDEMLGKLRFVELPGILEVFSPSEKLKLPISHSADELTEEKTVLILTASGAQPVAACMEGTVKEIGTDAEKGAFVRIAGRDDRELYLYGLSEITVEEGQPLSASDHVGSIADAGKLYLSVRAGGQPQNPLDYFEQSGSKSV